MRRAEGELKVIALAHSMGGHILLRRLHDRPDEFAAVALCAPDDRHPAARRALVDGGGGDPAAEPAMRLARILSGAWPSAISCTLPFCGADRHLRSGSATERTHERLAAHPELRLNGPTWGWLAAALKSIMLLHAPGYAEAITTPALVLAAGKDRVCNSEALYAFARAHAACHLPHHRRRRA